jgi:cell division septum initiation protein DivIVA
VIHHLLIFWQRKLEDAYHENHRLQEENKRLQAKVKRLTKAGDAIISQWNEHGLVEAQLRVDWHTAKEETQS